MKNIIKLNFGIIICIMLFLFAKVEAKKIDLFLENFSLEVSNDNSKYEAVIKLASEYVVDETLSVSKLRENNKKHFVSKIKEYKNAVDFHDLDVEFSSYAPYAFITFDSYSEYYNSKAKLNKICGSSYIENIIIEKVETQKEVNVNSEVTDNAIYFDTVKEMVGITETSPSFTGENIKVGVIDEGYPLLQCDNIVDYITTGYEEIDSAYETYHTSKILSIICSIAPNVEIYMANYGFTQDSTSNTTTSRIKTNIEWLLSKNVQIINMSYGEDTTVGIYDGYCAYLDYIIDYNNVLIVKSAGNNKNYVTSPGAGLNVLTVGSVCPSYNVSSFSSYGVQASYENQLLKPNLVAPGEFRIPLNINNTTIYNIFDKGTSFSAPIVSGIAALLMEEDNSLSTNVNKMITSLMAGATKLPSQTNLTEEECGVGIINYNNTRNVLLNSQLECTTNSLNITGETIIDFTFFVDNLDTKITMMTMSPYEFEYVSGVGIISQSIHMTTYTLEIYDLDYNYVTSYSSDTNFIIKELNLSSNSWYICEVVMRTGKTTNADDRISIIIS